MQMDKVARLQKDWAAKGNPPCEHPALAREYYLSMNTGDKVCTTCGEDFSPAELKATGEVAPAHGARRSRPEGPGLSTRR